MAQTPKTFAFINNIGQQPTLVYTAPSTGVIGDLVTDIILTNGTKLYNNNNNLSVSQVGTTGSAVYTYAVVARDPWGNITNIGPTKTTTTSNANMNNTNYNNVTWNPIAGASSYDLLFTTTNTSGMINIGGYNIANSLLASNISGTSFTHKLQGNATYYYNTPTAPVYSGQQNGGSGWVSGTTYYLSYQMVDSSGVASAQSDSIAWTCPNTGYCPAITVHNTQGFTTTTSSGISFSNSNIPNQNVYLYANNILQGTINSNWSAVYSNGYYSGGWSFPLGFVNGGEAPITGSTSSNQKQVFHGGDYSTPTTNKTGTTVYYDIYKVPSGGSPSISNSLFVGIGVGQGSVEDIQLNITLEPNESIYATAYTYDNTGIWLNGSLASIMLEGVEFS